jgi:hypothetical protein
MPSWGELSTPRQWFVTVRLVEVAAVAMLVALGIQLWSAWASTADFDPFAAIPTSGDPTIPFMSRVTSVVFFNDLRPTFFALVVVAGVVALGVGVLLRGPVANGRLVRWELLALWGVAMAVAVLVFTFHVLALFGQDPYASQFEPQPTPPDESYRPNMLVQLVAGAAWPVAGALCLAASGLWWLRLPSDLESADEDELEDELEEELGDERGDLLDGDPLDGDLTHRPGKPGTSGGAREERAAGADRGRVPRRPARTARQRRQADRDDVLLLDGVEQIEPVERLTPRDSGRDDGATSSGYDGYFRHF